jgi:hypothetical protein
VGTSRRRPRTPRVEIEAELLLVVLGQVGGAPAAGSRTRMALADRLLSPLSSIRELAPNRRGPGPSRPASSGSAPRPPSWRAPRAPRARSAPRGSAWRGRGLVASFSDAVPPRRGGAIFVVSLPCSMSARTRAPPGRSRRGSGDRRGRRSRQRRRCGGGGGGIRGGGGIGGKPGSHVLRVAEDPASGVGSDPGPASRGSPGPHYPSPREVPRVENLHHDPGDPRSGGGMKCPPS